MQLKPKSLRIYQQFQVAKKQTNFRLIFFMENFQMIFQHCAEKITILTAALEGEGDIALQQISQK